MIRVKDGVTFSPESFAYQQITRILRQADALAPIGYSPMVTSACDGQHKERKQALPWQGV